MIENKTNRLAIEQTDHLCENSSDYNEDRIAFNIRTNTKKS